MNRIFILLVVLFFSSPYLKAQSVQIIPHNTGWFPVDSYDGARVNNLLQIPIHINSSQSSQMQNWSLSFRVVGPITNGIQTFSIADVAKLKFQINSLTSQGSPNTNDNGQVATIGTLGLKTAKIPFSMALTDFVANSPYSLIIRNRYFQINLGYSVELEGGAYLEQYKSWEEYPITIAIEIRNRRNDIMPTGQPTLVSFNMRIMPAGAPPTDPQYALIVDPSAAQVLLEFNTPSDYANGVSTTQTKALSVISKTPYVLQVQTLGTELASATSTLPFNTVQLSMADSQSGIYMPGVNLSPNPQTLHSSLTHTTLKWYDLKYVITPPSTQNGFLNKPNETYTGTVIFTLTPQ